MALQNLTSPANNNVTTNRTPTFTWSGSDDDNDALQYEINLTCWQAGSIVTLGSQYNDTLGSATSYTPTSYLKCLSDNGQYYNWTTRVYDGEEYYPGKVITEFPADGIFLEHCQVHELVEMDGWDEEISHLRKFEDLPIAAQKYLERIEELGGVEISIVSVGPEREQTIFLPERWNFPVAKPKEKVSEPASFVQDLPSTKYKAIIYDMDNTLVATNEFVLDLIKRTALRVSQDIQFLVPSDEEIISVQKKNLPFEEIFSVLFPNPEGYRREDPLWKIILELTILPEWVDITRFSGITFPVGCCTSIASLSEWVQVVYGP